MQQHLERLWENALAFLLAVIEPFRFLKHARERRQEDLAAMREHTVELIDTLLGRIEKTEELRTTAMVEAAKASQAQAAALQTWFEMFKFDSMNQSPGVTVRPQDEWAAERQRSQQELITLGYPADKTPEEQMAWLLANGI